jgi:hypothetical protein
LLERSTLHSALFGPLYSYPRSRQHGGRH